MKKIFLKNTVAAASLLLFTGYAGVASAHEQSGSLGTGAGATDLYQVSCYNDGSGTGATSHLATSVVAGYLAAGIKVSVRTQKGSKATNTTDPINGDSVSSPFVYNAGGDGVYYMTVGKSAATIVPRSYNISFHCQNSSGGHTGTSWVMLQNQ